MDLNELQRRVEVLEVRCEEKEDLLNKYVSERCRWAVIFQQFRVIEIIEESKTFQAWVRDKLLWEKAHIQDKWEASLAFLTLLDDMNKEIK